jgi:hypothetical protein
MNYVDTTTLSVFYFTANVTFGASVNNVSTASIPVRKMHKTSPMSIGWIKRTELVFHLIPIQKDPFSDFGFIK